MIWFLVTAYGKGGGCGRLFTIYSQIMVKFAAESNDLNQLT